MQYVYVNSENRRTDILGQELLGSLNDLDLICIQWDDTNQCWVCYERGDDIPSGHLTSLADPTPPHSSGSPETR